MKTKSQLYDNHKIATWFFLKPKMINLNFKNVQIYFPHSGNGGTIVNLKLTIPEKKNPEKEIEFW